MEDINRILKQRRDSYGRFTDNACTAQSIKRTMRESVRWRDLSSDKREVLDMIASKISRIVTGNPEYKDNWHDIVGYATIIDNTLTDDKQS